jgi:O-antigen ligase
VVEIENLGSSQNRLANESRTHAIRVTTEEVFFVFFVGGLAWVPFWLGSDRLIPWGINAVVFAGLAAFYELSLIIRRVPHPVPIRCIRLSAILFVIATIWILIQNATWTPEGWHHPIWQLAAETLGRQIPGSISVDRDLTALALIRLMTAASVFWMALQLGRDAARALMMLWCVVGIGAIYAAVGLYAFAFLPHSALFEESVRFGHAVSSTFVNRNSYATYAGIGLITVVALIQRLYRRELHRSGDLLRLKFATLIETTGRQAAPALAMAFIILVALLLTGSRGGIILTAIGIFALGVVNMSRAIRIARNEALPAVFVTVFLTVLVSAVFIGFGDIFVERIVAPGMFEEGEGKLQSFMLALRSIESAPLLGYGYGTFAAVFPMFHDDSMSLWVYWDRAENTYLEVLQGLGLLFGAMLIGSVLALVFACVKGAKTRQRAVTIPTVAVGVSVLVGVHALVDFSLQVQAVTLTYMAILGVGVAQAESG